MPTVGKSEHRQGTQVRAVETENDDFLFGSCSVVTSTYLVLLTFVLGSALLFFYLYHQSQHMLIFLPIPNFIVISTMLAMFLQNHKLMYPIIIAKFAVFLVLFVCLIGVLFLTLTLSYNLLRYWPLAAHHEIYSNATRLVVLVNTMVWLFVGVVAITWELGVLVVCKEFYKSKQLCKSKHA
uniref:Uncharacterized protein n=1 Tax=Plectus sambesii TaxID=2011161 RepID=A0A914XGA8_9BILA